MASQLKAFTLSRGYTICAVLFDGKQKKVPKSFKDTSWTISVEYILTVILTLGELLKWADLIFMFYDKSLCVFELIDHFPVFIAA